MQVVSRLLEFRGNRSDIELRLLNDLTQTSRSQEVIRQICEAIGAEEQDLFRRAGSSNTTSVYRFSGGGKISVKIAFPYYLEAMCGRCEIRSQCFEGFYGIRLERLNGLYMVRLCIYKSTSQVLMPWREFLGSDLAKELQGVLAREHADDVPPA